MRTVNSDVVPGFGLEPPDRVGIEFTFDPSTPGPSPSRAVRGQRNHPKIAKAIAFDCGPQGQLYFFWSHEIVTFCELLFTRSLDSGQTYSAPISISGNTTGCHTDPQPVIDNGGTLNVAWHANGNEIFLARSTDQGQTFSTPSSAVGKILQASSQNFVVDSNGAIDLVYGSAMVGVFGFDVLFTRSTDHGAMFSTPIVISLPPGPNFTGGGDGVVAVGMNGRISVAWSDDAHGTMNADFDIYLKTSSDGATFSDAVNLTNTKVETEVIGQNDDAGGRAVSDVV